MINCKIFSPLCSVVEFDIYPSAATVIYLLCHHHHRHKEQRITVMRLWMLMKFITNISRSVP